MFSLFAVENGGKVMESSKIDPNFPMPEGLLYCTVYMNCCAGQARHARI